MKIFLAAAILATAAPDYTGPAEAGDPGDLVIAVRPESHFLIVSSAKNPPLEKIAARLETAWSAFHDLFGVSPETVKVTISVSSGAAAPSSQTDQGGPAKHEIAWAVPEEIGIDSQSFSDLAHEITHVYFIDYMEDTGGYHQRHAWLHEAVAIHAESAPFQRNRRQWIRDRLADRIALDQLFTMTNPQKENPLVELIAELNAKLHKGEIRVEEMHRRIAEFNAAHVQELMQAGRKNMTYYSQSSSLFEYLLELEGRDFIREMCQALKKGKSMEEFIRSRKNYPGGLSQLEKAWVGWVQSS